MASPTAPPPRPVGVLHPPGREGTLPVFAGSDWAAACGRRFKIGVSRPPPGCRRTPDHPPYAEMIQVALRTLAEDGGSTVDAISRCIAVVYLDLPWAHERLLPHYLGRLVATGDVAVAAPGRYALLSTSPAPAGGANPDPNLNPCSQAAPCAVQPDGPAGMVAPTLRSSSATAAVVDNGAGEGLGAGTMAVTVVDASCGGDGESECDRSSMPAIAAEQGGDKEWPSMPDPTSTTAFVVRQNERPFEDDRPSGAVAGPYASFLESKSWGKKGIARPPPKKSGRGRRSNVAKYHWQLASGTQVAGPGVGGSSVLPKKGRNCKPPKCKPTADTSDAIPANDNMHLLNFSCSYDPDCMEVSRDAYSSRSLGDGTSSAGVNVLSNSGSPAPRLKVDFHVPRRHRTSMHHKPRKISTTLFEERVSSQPLNQWPEQMVCALPANVQDSSPTNIARNRPQIEGWVQVLPAVQPRTPNRQQAKVKKSRQHHNESKMVHPVVQFGTANFLLTTSLEDVAQKERRMCH